MKQTAPRPVPNAEVADAFEHVADLLEFQEANPYRVRAYRTAARTLRSAGAALCEVVRAGRPLPRLAGIGPDLAGKIEEFVKTGHLGLLDELQAEVPETLVDLLDVPGLGPKRLRALSRGLGVTQKDALLRAAREGRVRALPGFGPKTEDALRSALESDPPAFARTLWGDAEPVAREVVAHLSRGTDADQVTVAGSYRRYKETVGDLDVLVASGAGRRVVQQFVRHGLVARVLARGATKASVLLENGLQVDLRVVEPVSWGAALVYFTGSKEHNIALRRRGMRRSLKVNEYGVFQGRRRVGGRTEASIYEDLGLKFIEPELREDRGEIEAAEEGSLPSLIELCEVRGDLHVHAPAGDAELEALAAAAKARGYEYLAIVDPVGLATPAAARGSAAALRQHVERVERLDGRVSGLRLLRAAEIGIRADGRLAASASQLDELDVCLGVLAPVTGRATAKGSMRATERVLRAMDDPHFHILGRPTGRRLGVKGANAVPTTTLDIERVVRGAAERGVWLELDVDPRRLDLPDVHGRAAKEAGAALALGTEAQSGPELERMRFGVGYARRAWLTAGDVVNSLSRQDLVRALRR